MKRKNSRTAATAGVLKKFTGTVDPFYVVSEGNIQDVLDMLPGQKINQTRWSGFSMLHRAAQLGYTDICQILLEHGADVNMCSVRGWYTPLHMALGAGYLDTAHYLLKQGAKPWKKCKSGQDAFDYAANQGFKALALELRAKLVKVEMSDAIAKLNSVVGAHAPKVTKLLEVPTQEQTQQQEKEKG
jgi:hypothetical protein